MASSHRRAAVLHGWRKDANNNQAVIDRMVSRSIRSLTVQKNDTYAWSVIFKLFQSHTWWRQRRV